MAQCAPRLIGLAQDGSWPVGGGGSGEHTLALRKELTDIQYGRREDTHGWLLRLDADAAEGSDA